MNSIFNGLPARKYLSIVTIFAILSFLTAWFYYRVDTQDFPKFEEGDYVVINAMNNEYIVFVDIADTQAKRAKGLMYVEEMPNSKGMIFLFESDVRHGFWMKNTKIPLDMIFIDKDFEIVHIKQYAEPCIDGGECPSFAPDEDYRYVLEINGGLSTVWGIEKGDTVSIPFIVSK